MRNILRETVEALQSGRPLVYCAVVATRGSTPQKAGAAMLVYPDGRQSGTLGGGCTEAEVKQKALGILARGSAERGAPEVVGFTLDDDYGWDDGLICGGRMDMLVEPLAGDDGLEYFRTFRELVERGDGCTEAVVVDCERAGIATAGARFLFDIHGKPVAGRYGPVPENAALAAIGEMLDHRRPWTRQGIAFLPIRPRCRLVIVGGGHVGQAVGALAQQADFDVWVVDDRKAYANAERFPQAERILVGEIGPTLEGLEITPNTYCLIVTRGHQHDEEALYHLADRGARYVGMIGSKRKVRLIFDDLIAQGISAEALEKVHAPVGLDIGSQTVSEIAVSIVAQLIAQRNLGAAQKRGAPSAECGA